MRTRGDGRGRAHREDPTRRRPRRHRRLRLHQGDQAAPALRLPRPPAPPDAAHRRRMGTRLVGTGQRPDRRRRAPHRGRARTRQRGHVRRHRRRLLGPAPRLRPGVHGRHRLRFDVRQRHPGLRQQVRRRPRDLRLPVHAAVPRRRPHPVPDHRRRQPGRVQVVVPAGRRPHQAAARATGPGRAGRRGRPPPHRDRPGGRRARLHPARHRRLLLPRLPPRAPRHRRRRPGGGRPAHDRLRRRGRPGRGVDPRAGRGRDPDPGGDPARPGGRLRRRRRRRPLLLDRRQHGHQRGARLLVAGGDQRRVGQPRPGRRDAGRHRGDGLRPVRGPHRHAHEGRHQPDRRLPEGQRRLPRRHPRRRDPHPRAPPDPGAVRDRGQPAHHHARRRPAPRSVRAPRPAGDHRHLPQRDRLATPCPPPTRSSGPTCRSSSR